MIVSGVVKCKEICSSSLKIILSPVGSRDAKLKQVISLTSSKFSFENVIPGKYQLEVSVPGQAILGMFLPAMVFPATYTYHHRSLVDFRMFIE